MINHCVHCNQPMSLGEYCYADPPRVVKDAQRSMSRFATMPAVRQGTVLCGACVGRVYRQQRNQQKQETAA